jgi:catechol 2,3-dioxygenase
MTVRGEVAHIGHAELLTPKFDESLWFFEQLMGMEIEAREGDCADLRGFGDDERYCLKLTASDTSGLGHLALRASSEAALERRVAGLGRSGVGDGWHGGDLGHGRADRVRDPHGRPLEI